MKVVEIRAPEYQIDVQPDYMAVGTKVDALIGSSFADGRYVIRSIGSSDHPDKSLDQLAKLILALGTDKYEADRKEVAHEDFRGYDHDFQGGLMAIADGQIVVDEDALYPSLFGDIIYHFYEHTLYDRGFRVRIDLLLMYHADALERATRVDPAAPRVRAELEDYLYKFKDPVRKPEALAGVVKILAA